MKTFLRTAVTAATLCAAGAASAGASGIGSIVWDQGPGTGAVQGSYMNDNAGQNFADAVRFDEDTWVGGINLFSGYDLSGHAAGNAFQVKVLADAAGSPGGLLYSGAIGFADSSNGVVPDTNEYRFAFAPMLFQAHKTYWVGIAGNGFDAGQVTLAAPGDGHLAQFQGATFQYSVDVGDQMYQLTGAVPEPETYALMLAGLGLVGFAARRQTRSRP